MLVLPEKLHFSGMDKRTDEEISLEIYKDQVEEISLGFDESFNAMETRGLGLTWLPLRLQLNQNGSEKKLYIITDYRLGWTDNQEYFEYLKKWVSP